MPTIISPAEAHRRRMNIMNGATAKKREDRVQSRRIARDQRNNATRPKRQRNEGKWVTFASVNVTSAERLRNELARGGELAECDCLGIQEHALHGDGVAAAEGWLKKRHWTGTVDEAYYKVGGYGGGTAALSRHPGGLRPAGARRPLLKGRCTHSISRPYTSICSSVF